MLWRLRRRMARRMTERWRLNVKSMKKVVETGADSCHDQPVIV